MEITQGRWLSKTLILSTNVDKKSLKTEFSIAIFRHTGDKWQLKTLFLAFFYPLSSLVKSIFDCRLPGVEMVNPFCTHLVFGAINLRWFDQTLSLFF